MLETQYTDGAGLFITWLPFIIYFLAALPQIRENYRNQSTEGMSYRAVFFDYTGALSTTIYTFFLGLPLACKVMEPLCAGAIFCIVLQCFYYVRTPVIRRNLFLSYGVLHTVCIGMVMYGYYYAAVVGMIMGWVSCTVQFFTQLPQVIKNRRRRSVEGLSFTYVTLLGIAALAEMTVAKVLCLPLPSFVNGLRGVGYYAVLCYQFFIYRKKKVNT